MIKANFSAYASYVTDSLYQWDVNQVLSVSGLNVSTAPEVHFSNANMDKAIVRQSTLTDHVVNVKIPNSLLQDPLTIHAHIGIYEGDTFKVIERVEIPIIPRKRPADYTIETTDEEIYSFEALKNMLANKADATVTNARIDAIIANSNSTNGNSELVDIRVGADGKTRGSAGTAIREQFLMTMRSTGKYLDANNYTTLFTDANDAPSNQSYFITSSLTDAMVANLPEYKKFGMLMTFSYSTANNHGKSQFYLTETGNFYWRFEQGNGDAYNWTDWGNPAKADDMNQLIRPSNIQISTSNYSKNLSDANDAVHGYVYFINQDVTEKMVSNLPVYGHNSLLVTVPFNKNNKHGKFQLFVNGNGLYSRMEEGHAENYKWYDWVGKMTETEVATIAQKNTRDIMRKESTNKNTCSIFAKVCCCGDSFTSGHISINNDPATVTNEKFAWPSFMARLTGNEYINCGQSGANVLTWQTSERGLLKARNVGKVQAYIIGLGLNDIATGTNRFVELGTIADIGTDAETYYGGLSKIIRELNAISPNALVFVQTMPSTGDLAVAYNEAIRNVVAAYAAKYHTHLLDLYAYRDMYENDSLTGDRTGGHYTAIGYQQFAEILRVIWSEYINDNIASFQHVHLVEYDE